jgi:hypothetical protein
VSDRTGFALGQLSAIVYFENADGEIVLPPTTEDARYFYEAHYRGKGYEIREAGTLAEVDRLQNRLVEAERRKNERAAEHDETISAARWREVGDRLRQRMVSSATTPYEREFIELYLKLREDKRDRHRQRWLERVSYLFAREMDSGTKATDRMRSEEGDRWQAN